MMTGRFHGGRHTEEKLHIIRAYLQFFATALKEKGFSLLYIDAFAGTGDYMLDLGDAGMLAGFGGDQGLVSRPGSARLALAVQPPFQQLIFVDKNAASIAALREIRAEHPKRSIEIRQDDANQAVRDICTQIPWHRPSFSGRGTRAVMFLDPFALSVEWETLMAIGKTQAIDLWYLFPTNAIGRLLAHDQTAITGGWEKRLDAVLGGNWWKQELYTEERIQQQDLFGNCSTEASRRIARLDQIEQAFLARLKPHFGFIADRPRRLYQRNLHRFSLMFAVANRDPRAWGLAKRVAEHIIKPPKG